jgi:hypothetical protein
MSDKSKIKWTDATWKFIWSDGHDPSPTISISRQQASAGGVEAAVFADGHDPTLF